VAESQLQTNASSSQSQTNASSSAGTYHNVFKFNLDGLQVYNSCTNELMTIHGDRQVAIQFMYNDIRSTFTRHLNGTGVTAIGESGREYIVSGSQNYQVSGFFNGVYTEKEVVKLHFITAGSESNFIISSTLYIKVDAEGNVTVIREPVSETYCK
jgi:hypothetical protein